MPSNLPMIGLRIPPSLKQAAERAAAADHRSVSNWIVALITREVSRMTQTQRVEPLGRLDLISLDASANPPAPMSVYLEIDTRDGSLHIGYRHQCDNAVPMNVWHGIVRRLEIPLDADGQDLTTAINSGEIDALITQIVAGSSVEWDGSNHVGNATEDAEDALEALCDWLVDQGGALPDGAGLWDAGDWLVDGVQSVASVTGHALTAETGDDVLGHLAQTIEADALSNDVVLYGTYEILEQLRQELRDAQEDSDE